MRDQVMDTLREFDDFTFTAEFEINPIISRRGVIHGFFEIKQGLHHLARQYKADPNAQQKGKQRNYAEHPFRTVEEMVGRPRDLVEHKPSFGFPVRTLVAGPAGFRLWGRG